MIFPFKTGGHCGISKTEGWALRKRENRSLSYLFSTPWTWCF
ncbi:hypothetical protein MICA_2340 [Micavibrio aeruginosavorus ARL-13]|uniref:Uncharacterized protein n=1 Tax=Micavibrio aeruginosavorus (strain ARL-13) TaxID=856793 RepID=G2KME9_MICAA|nr:hypothetical protein MICA_2340 [Micavibrio aeruginosavorus ARL-13]